MSGAAFDGAWAVLMRNTGWLDGDKLDVVDVLQVYWEKADAVAEVDRLRADDPRENDHFYYCEETQVERRL
jgi:hypothetical protein